jgi:isopenicillin-N epimerase
MIDNAVIKSQFLLREDITYLNFGSFGSCPKPIFKTYQDFQLELEQEPVQYITNNGPKHLQKAREALGHYINCDPKDVVYVTNPSYAVNLVAKNFKLEKGDEVLTTSLEYGACDRIWDYYCKKVGAKYVKQTITLPFVDKNEVVSQLFKGVTSKTKLIFLSHITSSTALCFPIEDICIEANKRGILIYVDGAHAPGQVDLDMRALKVDFYTGACHKWMMAPKGNSFLYTKKEHQDLLDPLVISWGFEALFPSDSKFLDYHQFNGTRDFSAFLCTPKCIEFMEEFNWQEVAKNSRKLVLENAEKFCGLLDAKPLADLDGDFIFQMCSAEVKTTEPEKLYKHIFENYNVEIPISRHGTKNYMRYSINGFNDQKDLDRLFEVLEKVKRTTSFIEN